MRTHTTDAQRDAARTNGAKSEGPVTPEGKERSSQNATRHGLNSKAVVLANESQEAYDELLATIRREWQPQGPTENDLVRDMADARWRLRRIKAIETAVLDSEMFVIKEAFEASFEPGPVRIALRTLLPPSLQGAHPAAAAARPPTAS